MRVIFPVYDVPWSASIASFTGMPTRASGTNRSGIGQRSLIGSVAISS